jgi:hypothetical protein
MNFLRSASDDGSSGTTRRSILATPAVLKGAYDAVSRELERVSTSMSSDLVARGLILDLAWAREGCLQAVVDERMARWFPFAAVRDRVFDALDTAGLLRRERAETLERGELLLVGAADSEVLTSESWSSIGVPLRLMLDAIPFGLNPVDSIERRMAAALKGHDLDAPIEEFVQLGYADLARSGILRKSLAPCLGDPRPVLYLMLDEGWREKRLVWTRRSREAANTLFDSNPYRPHLVVVVGHVLDDDESAALAWHVRRFQIPDFDSATIVWDVTACAPTPEDVLARASKLRDACRAAHVSKRVVFRPNEHLEQHADSAFAIARAMSCEVAFAFDRDASPATVDMPFFRSEIALGNHGDLMNWIVNAPSARALAVLIRSVVTTNECLLGHTLTLTLADARSGCPLCAKPSSTLTPVDLESIRAAAQRRLDELAARDSKLLDLSEVFRGFPFARRSCL